MKKAIAVFLAAIMAVGVMTVPVFAQETPAGEYGTHYVKYGDVNFDEVISAADALEILKSVVGKVQFTEHQIQVADVNNDDVVAAADALDVLRLVVGKITAFEAGVYYVLQEVTPDPDPTPDPEPEPDNPVNNGNIANYDKSNSVNGAYEKDPTADTSFVTDLSTLDANTVYRLSSAPLNPSQYTTPLDFARLIYSLQGLVNRDFGMDDNHTTMIAVITETADVSWMNEMTAEGSILQYANAEAGLSGLTEKRINSWDDFLNTFLPVMKECGIILWDGNVPATANVAATICGLDGYLPVLANSPLHTILVEKGVPVKQSLVGLFKNGQKGTAISGTSIASTGSAKNDAYLWALENYFYRCSSKYLAYTLDGAICLKGYSAYGYADHPTALIGGNHCLSNHDYLIARRCFFFDLAPYAGEAACDDPAQKNGQAAVGTDNATLMKILQARYNRANGAFGALMGFPPWWCKYTKQDNQGSKDGAWIEWLYCEYITCYNLAKEADAQAPASMTNGSVFYKYIPMLEEYKNNTKPSENLSFDRNTYYYTIYVGDYDSSAWLKQHIFTMWIQRGGDKKRGTLPLMWSINPNLSDRVPVIFDYMYENKTELDYFVGGDGGAGYIIPEGLFQDRNLAYAGIKRPNAAGGGIFAAYSKKYYDRFGMEMTGFMINGAQHTVTANIADCFSRYSPKLNFTNCFNTRVGKYGSTYFVYCQNGIDLGSQETMYSHAQTTLGAGVNFSAYRTVCKKPSEISKMVSDFDTYASQKGMKVKYLDPYAYYNLLKASGQGGSLGTPSAPSNFSTPTPSPYIPPEPTDPDVVVPFDTIGGISTAFSTSASIETNNKQEGGGALRLDFAQPTAESAGSKIGGMVYYEFTTPVDLSAAETLTLDYWIPEKINGSSGLQINFVTNGKEDGFNFMQGIDNASAGWHTLTINKKSPGVTANNPNWSSIRAIRITYFNYANNAKPTFMLLDNLRIDGETGGGTATPDPEPPVSTQGKTLLNFDSLAGFVSHFQTSVSIESNNKSEGLGSMRLGFGNPTGQASTTKIGGMIKYEFDGSVDLSKATKATIDYWIPKSIAGEAGIQVNFITNGSDDGYNFMLPINNATAGWHTLSIDLASPSATANSPKWSEIRAIRITYFNLANNAEPAFMLMDNLTVDADFTVQAGSKTVLVDFENNANITTAFATSATADAAQHTQGSNAIRLDFTNPTGQSTATKIGGMMYYTFATPVDLSSASEFTLDYYLPAAITGSAGIQINFVTNGQDDGYNFMTAINDAAAGWHTITIGKASPSTTANNPNWASIRAIRITYFNYANNATPTSMYLDNLTVR